MQERVALGSHFAQPTEDLIAVSAELARRFGLPLWRFGNSGTESTMDAIHLMRAKTGRVAHHQGRRHVPRSPRLGAGERLPGSRRSPDRRGHPRSIPAEAGIPADIARLTVVVPFGDLDAVERALWEYPGEIAGMILEPMMMNLGIIAPPDGYLAGLVELSHAHGAYLCFDEVKTGLATAPGGMIERSGVTPDIVCLAKALGGGLPCGAIGGTEELMGLIVDGSYDQVGTFNGNPLTMAAARATLLEVLDARRVPALRRAARGDGRRRARRAAAVRPARLRRARTAPRVRSCSRDCADCTTTASSSPTTRVGVTRTGCSSTTAACTSRRGASASSGRSPRSTRVDDANRFVANLETFARAFRIAR